MEKEAKTEVVYAITEPKKGPFSYEHRADFSVITIGTGSTEPVIGRTGPCTLVQYKGRYFMVDVGDGAAYSLCQMGIPLNAVHNVLFTHHHADHNEGYTKWAINSWMAGRETLTLVGPPKTKKFHEMLLDFYEEDLAYRSTLEGLDRDAMYKANISEYEGSNTFVLDGATITTAELTHTMYNIGYRFEVEGKTIVVSGDTSYDENLITLAKDADILVMDSGTFSKKEFIGASKPLSAGAKLTKGEGEPLIKHSDETSVPAHPRPGQVAQMAIAANVKILVLTHFPPFIVDEETTIKEIKDAGFEGDVIISKDLMEIVPK